MFFPLNMYIGSLILPKIKLSFDFTFSPDENNPKNYSICILTTELNGLPCKESDSL